ncbi:MAG: DUF1275 domain-containing protein [Firmicutes bacterium]|nr:DUF1275 domain-containing protein [Bacillota bacterium]
MGNEIKSTPFFEKAQFLIGITLLGGYVNTYAFIARGGNMVSFHTGNQIRCGMSLAYGNMSDFVFYLMPILMCFGGVCLSEILKWVFKKSDWRLNTMLIEAVVLFLVGLIPISMNTLASYTLSVLAGTHFCVFRSFEGAAHNSTIGTGNLRNLAQLFCKAVTGGNAAKAKFLRYFSVFMSFPIGAFLGTWITVRIGTYGIWPLSALMFVWALIYYIQTKHEKAQKAAQAAA